MKTGKEFVLSRGTIKSHQTSMKFLQQFFKILCIYNQMLFNVLRDLNQKFRPVSCLRKYLFSSC